ncbi:MAG: signal peptidase I [Candidatus Hydrogenedentes bacterium]|nr:signal peptidase I [Candidatus Hydrogenedentota bacterium]
MSMVLPGFFHSQKVGLIAVLVLACIGLYAFAYRGMRFFIVPSRSMEPTLLPEDQLVTLRQSAYHRGDIVVVNEPETGEYLVKRVVGLPGDKIAVYNGALYLNGDYASEPYIAELMEYTMVPPIEVKEHEVFLLGDNRNESDDGHLSGKGTPESAIVGRVRLIYFPYQRLGPVLSYPLVNAQGG